MEPVEKQFPDTPKPPGGIEFYGGYQVYSESGVDLTLLRENLKLTATDRLRKNRRKLPMLNALAEAGHRGRKRVRLTGEIQAMLNDEAIFQLLAEYRVAYVLLGGLAMRVHGSAHITEDVDICYSRSPANLQAVVSAFATIHPYLRGAPPGLPFCFDVPTIQAGLNFTLTTDLGDIDLLGEVSGVGNYDAALALSEEQMVYGVKIHALSIEGLLKAKRAASRWKDQGHILELEEMKKMRDQENKEQP